MNCELTAPVSKDDLKQDPKGFAAKLLIESIEHICDGSGSIGIPKEGKHQFAIAEVDGEKNFTAFASLHGVHFSNSDVRIS